MPASRRSPAVLTLCLILALAAGAGCAIDANNPEARLDGVRAAATEVRELFLEPPFDQEKYARAEKLLITAVTAYLESLPANESPPHGERLARLEGALPDWDNRPADIRVADLDGDGREELLLAANLFGLPAQLYFRGGQAGRWQATSLLPSLADPNSRPGIARVEDLNRDGRLEFILTQTTAGASSTTLRLNVLGWTGKDVGVLFQATINDWLGPAGWELVERGDAPADIRLTYSVMGIHDHKLIEHRQRMELYRWRNGRYDLVASETSTPTTYRQLINVAESLYARGDFEPAVGLFTAVVAGDPTLDPEDEERQAWTAFAHFRLGEIAALHGVGATARQHLEIAAGSGGYVARAARAFLAGGSGSVLRALVAAGATEVDVDSFGRAGELPVGMDIRYLRGGGLILAEYLNRAASSDRTAPALLAGDLAAGLGELTAGQPGLELAGLELAEPGDPAGAGIPAVATAFGSGPDRSVWLAVRDENRWRAALVGGPDHSLAGSRTLPGGRRAFILAAPRGEIAFSLAGDRLEFLDARTGKVLSSRPLFPNPDGEKMLP